MGFQAIVRSIRVAFGLLLLTAASTSSASQAIYELFNIDTREGMLRYARLDLVKWPNGTFCTSTGVQRQLDEMYREMKKGSPLAGSNAKSAAEMFAACAIVFRDKPAAGSATHWASLTGEALYTAYVGKSVDEAAANRAVKYLEFASGNGDKDAAKILENVKKSLSASDGSSGAATAKFTAVEMVKNYTDNSFGFLRKFEGKNVEATGVIANISGSAKEATITIEGAPNLSMENHGMEHFVFCKSRQPEQLDKIASLSKGKKIRVKGILKYSDLEPLALTNCMVL